MPSVNISVRGLVSLLGFVIGFLFLLFLLGAYGDYINCFAINIESILEGWIATAKSFVPFTVFATQVAGATFFIFLILRRVIKYVKR